MSEHIEVGKIVKLTTFNGEAIAPADIDAGENYWKLIGSTGVIHSITPPKNVGEDRILVVFHLDLDSLNLSNHNQVKNALWIKYKDLFQL
jgi:hypothetical protein